MDTLLNLEWRDPLFLLTGLLAPVVFVLATRSSAKVNFSSLVWADQSPRSVRVRLAPLPPILLAIATLLLAVALAGPRTGNAETRIKREGIAIALVVDASSSMRARDLVPEDRSVDRLAVVKDVITQFITGGERGRGRPDDLVGLVKFGRYADGLCPLTLDHGNLVSMIQDLTTFDPGAADDGTAVGEGLALAVERLRREQQAKSKVAIVLTDGVNNAGDISPQQAAELAKEFGVRVYTIGAGTRGYAPYPRTDRLGREHLRDVRVEIDEDTLKDVARRTDGRYYRATHAQGLAEVYEEIDQLERTEIRELRYLQYEEHYAIWVMAALSCVAIAGIASGTFLRRLP